MSEDRLTPPHAELWKERPPAAPSARSLPSWLSPAALTSTVVVWLRPFIPTGFPEGTGRGLVCPQTASIWWCHFFRKQPRPDAAYDSHNTLSGLEAAPPMIQLSVCQGPCSL